MITMLRYPIERSYRLEQPLEEAPVYDSWSTLLSVDDQDLISKKLGSRGYGRMLAFTRFYTTDWGEGNQQVSPRGLSAFLRFLRAVNFRDGADPSVFLSNDGEVQLAWSDAHGHAIQLLFGPEEIGVFHEGQKRDDIVALNEYNNLAQAFSDV